MKIQRDLCSKCGRCVIECHKHAISKDGEGNYLIDISLCDNCGSMSEIECIRFCPPRAITREDGTIPDFDPTWRLRAEHIHWAVAIMGDRDRGTFPADNREYSVFRKMIAAAMINPNMKIRVVQGFDDICAACPTKAEHAAGCMDMDKVYCDKFGIEPGTVMGFWDAVRMVEDRLSIPFLREKLTFLDYCGAFLESLRTFVSPDAKLLTNTED